MQNGTEKRVSTFMDICVTDFHLLLVKFATGALCHFYVTSSIKVDRQNL